MYPTTHSGIRSVHQSSSAFDPSFSVSGLNLSGAVGSSPDLELVLVRTTSAGGFDPLCVFWVDGGNWRKNSHRHRENMQTPQRKARGQTRDLLALRPLLA
ncbi:hypothetical protein NQD34_012399 [Periophthalmus magnuspinnatus]|nr:hypothetical protein NQD34_012399 [Periophthalmus magnuspinnatus]